MINIDFNSSLKNEIKDLSNNRKDIESCGLIYFDEKKLKFNIYSCKNIAFDKKNFFSISSLEYLKCSQLGKIVACFHSHNNDNNEFSEIDMLNSNKHNITFILYNIKNDIFNMYYPNTYKNKYIGRPYITEVSDCFSLAIDYYKKELNVSIYCPKEIAYPKNLKDINSIYEDFFEKQNFIKLDKNTPFKKHDAFFMLFPNVSEVYATHCAMNIGNNTILHHPYNSFSCVNIYDDFYRKHTKYIVRHRSMI
jgi:proteasome lid subunit RPN8/RPN11